MKVVPLVSLNLTILALVQATSDVPRSAYPLIEPQSSADTRGIARPNLGAAAVARGQAQADALLVSVDRTRAEADRQEAETQRLHCIASYKGGKPQAPSCAR